ncbi:MAG: DUF6089 family protein [Bacteroidales bacterium]|nr:DUF6089 family protein [Bacteroidales bacterium]
MKISTGLLMLAFMPLAVFAQRKADYGIFGGVSSYLGDINPEKAFYSPSPAAGFFYRYNLHPRHSLRAAVFAGGLNAEDRDFDNAFQQNRDASFSGSAAEMTVQFEFNFFPYATEGKRWNSTPYFAGGVGMVLVDAEEAALCPAIPISLGFKINVGKNIGLEAEYGVRKTFYDNFDGLNYLTVPEDYHVWTHNNDWYTFMGICITWKIFNKLAGCPAYYDVDAKRKR